MIYLRRPNIRVEVSHREKSQCVELETVKVGRPDATDLEVDLGVMIEGWSCLYPLLPLLIPDPEGLQGAVETCGESVQLFHGGSDSSRACMV